MPDVHDVHDVLNTPSASVHDVLNTPRVHDVLNTDTQETGIQCGDTEAGLTGETVDGTPIEGADAIQTVGC